MLTKLIWHLIGLGAAGGISYGTYIAYGQLPAWLKGTEFNDLKMVLALILFMVALSLGEAVWSRLPKRPKEGINGGKKTHTPH
jgi:hypothetical protein